MAEIHPSGNLFPKAAGVVLVGKLAPQRMAASVAELPEALVLVAEVLQEILARLYAEVGMEAAAVEGNRVLPAVQPSMGM